MIHHRTLLASVALAALAAAPSAAQMLPGDGDLSVEDFSAMFDESGRYEAVDADADGALSRDEFATSIFADYDRDNDMTLSEDEYALGNGRYLGEGAGAAYSLSDADADASGDIDPQEFSAHFGAELGNDLWERWDADRDDRISVEEYRQGAYASADTDADQTLSTDEQDWFAEWAENSDALGNEIQNIGDAAYAE